MNLKTKILTAAALLCTAVATFGQGDYASILELRKANGSISGVRSTADGEYYTFRAGQNIARRSYANRAQSAVLLEVPFEWIDYTFSPDERTLLVAAAEGSQTIYRHSFTADYWIAKVGGVPEKILSVVRDVTFTPDGKSLVYAKENNLYIYDIATAESKAITDDGRWNEIINGTTDWVYEEEFGFTQAYAISPDSRKVAYLRFDESQVPIFEMMRFDGSLYNKAYSFKYPKAGDKNSVVELWVYDRESGTKRKVDVGAESDQYISQLGWTPAGELYFFRVNRRQNHFEIVVDNNGAQRVAYDEKAPQYVERKSASDILFVDADRFIVREETTTGYMHLYLHSLTRGRICALTSGAWEVTRIVGCDGRNIWYLSTERSPLQRDLCRVALNGKKRVRLTKDAGYYAIAPSRGMKYYISTFSSASTPNVVTVHKGDGSAVDVLVDSRKAVAALGKRATKEFFTFTTERGDTLNAYMVRPLDFDPSKRYPVLLTQYSGPGSQSVADRWSVDWEDAVVPHGYIVVCTDGRGTGYRGEAFKKATYGRLGAIEVEDQISLAKYMSRQKYVDAERIGIYGWSYGGFMALGCALRGDGLFKMAISVAPVTTWRYYDTIYTEIYNGLPQDNPSGYDDNSPINFAERLHDRTRLLIMHGTADDNVHLQNTIEMTRALNRAGKQYDMMIYPDQNHSMRPNDTSNIRQKMVEYTLRNL